MKASHGRQGSFAERQQRGRLASSIAAIPVFRKSPLFGISELPVDNNTNPPVVKGVFSESS
jgi:hypothetical protein